MNDAFQRRQDARRQAMAYDPLKEHSRAGTNPSEEEIMAGMLRWEPGSLSKTVLERVLIDALSDLYGDSFRRGQSIRDRNTAFLADLKRCVQHATGVDLVSLKTTAAERR